MPTNKRINVVSLRLVKEKTVSYPATLRGPGAVVSLARDLLDGRDREHFLSVFLDTKNRPIGCEIASVGTASSCLVSPGVVFRAALLSGATGVIFVHNHPSGDPTPSSEDYELTRVLLEAGKLLCIRVLDHLVLGDDSWVSIRDEKPLMEWS